MKLFKYILFYTVWSLLALLIAICGVTFFLGTTLFSSEEQWWQIILNRFYQIGLIQTGFYIGCIVDLSFILIDIFYIRDKLKNRKSVIIRFLILLGLTLMAGTVYYILEKVIDVI